MANFGASVHRRKERDLRATSDFPDYAPDSYVEVMIRLTFAPASTTTTSPVPLSTQRGKFVREDGIR